MPVSVKLPNELYGRLAEYRLMDKKFQNKYNMDFEEFKYKRIVEESVCSFEVEEDFCDWDLALDGIETINNEFKKPARYT